MILTLDVGLKNLAICVMECSNATELDSYRIVLWDTLNTLEQESFTCKGKLKSGAVCGKKATCQHTIDDNMLYTCKTHFPKSIKYSSAAHDVKTKKVDDFLLQDIAKIVIAKVQELYDTNTAIFEQITSILIELQPKVNQKMKFTSHIIYGKFVELYKDTPTKIRFVRASQKLKAYTGPQVQCQLKGSYAKRKWLSIQYVKWFLETKFAPHQKDLWLPWLESHSKKDDACDTFLMAINALHGMPKSQTRSKKGKCIK